MMRPILLLSLVTIIFVSSNSCKREVSCEGCSAINKAPIANAGPDQSITLPVDSALLDGSTSTDPDGTINEWKWTKISGPASFTFSNSTISKPVVKNLAVGLYSFELLVKDDDGHSAKDTMQITVIGSGSINQPPVANAGPDQTIILPANMANLDGRNSFDPDNNISGYVWEKISGPVSINFSHANSIQTQINNLVQGVYLLELKVTDADGLFDRDTIQITVTNTSPPDPCGTMGALSLYCTGYWVCASWPGVQSVSYTSNSNFYQAYGASTSTQNKVYFAGGHDDFWVYGGSLDGGIEYDAINHSSRCFTLSVPRSFLAGATAGSKILFAGGNNVSGYTNPSPVYNAVDIYDEQTLTHSVAVLSEARSHLASVSFGTHAYFIGGKTQNGFSAKMDVYDASTNSWKVVNMPRQRGHAGAAVIGNNIYVAGGKNNAGNIRSIDIYNIQSGQWSSIEAPNDHSVASVAAINNKLIVAGGDGLSNRSADIYNATTDQWTSVNLSNSRFNMTVASANNKIVFFGGANTFSGTSFSNESDGIDIYDDNSGAWLVGAISPGVNGLMAASFGGKIIYTGFMYSNATIIANTMLIITP